MSECTVDNCGRPHRARGWCEKHYRQARANGLATLPRRSVSDRFWEKVDKTDSCWLWTGAKHPLGYGSFRIGGNSGRAYYSHRLSYEMLKGPIPEGLSLDHLCRNASCVNPDHLEPVTHRENVLRGISPAAQQARMTVCKQGLHPLSGDNLYTHSGKRRCRACYLAWRAARGAA